MTGWLRGMLKKLSSKSDTSVTIMYGLTLLPALTTYCKDGLVEIDKSAVERALRGVAPVTAAICLPVASRKMRAKND